MHAKAVIAAKEKGLPAPSTLSESCSLQIYQKESGHSQAHSSYLRPTGQPMSGGPTPSELCKSYRSPDSGGEGPIPSFMIQAVSSETAQHSMSPPYKSDNRDQPNDRLPFACFCGHTFKDLQRLKDHISLAKNQLDQCSSCLAVFKTHGLAREHIRRAKEGHSASTRVQVSTPAF